jgi:hypothetical protein
MTDSSSSLSILNAHYETILNDLRLTYVEQSSNNTYLQKVLAHFQGVANYNVLDGKKVRGTGVIDAVRALSANTPDENLLKQAAVLGWCIELMQGAFLVADDLMDHSLTRRGKPCWYLQVTNKHSAINDAFYLYSCTFTLLSQYFPGNVKLIHLFNEIFQRTVIGQGHCRRRVSLVRSSVRSFARSFVVEGRVRRLLQVSISKRPRICRRSISTRKNTISPW